MPPAVVPGTMGLRRDAEGNYSHSASPQSATAQLPPEITAAAIPVSEKKLPWTSTKSEYDNWQVNYHPWVSEYNLLEPLPPALLRSQLTAIDQVQCPNGAVTMSKYNPH
ncbi:hypothetical protein OQA88_5239 [Cercophora sp. LCS_1]